MRAVASLSVSLDGFYTGPGPSPSQPLGVGGDVLHSWFAHDVADRRQLTADEILGPEFERTGAMIMGRDSYDHAQELWGPRPPFEMPIFVLTSRPRPDDVRQGTTFHFVNEILDDVFNLATQAAAGKDVGLHGGGAINQALRADLLDELQLHVVPTLLGGGRWLFDGLGADSAALEIMRVAEGAGVTHLKYRVVSP